MASPLLAPDKNDMRIRKRHHVPQNYVWMKKWGMHAAVMVVILLIAGVQWQVSSIRSNKLLRIAQLNQQGGGGLRKGEWISKNSQPFVSREWAEKKCSDHRKVFFSYMHTTQNMDELASRAKHLIVVAGHSVTVSGDLEDADRDEKDWFLLDYQKHRGLPAAIVAHIQAGIQYAHLHQDSLLVFSGGETRAITGPETEGASYYHVADAMKLWPPTSTVRARTTTEEFATDSFENLMFSICRFREITGSYPQKITVVSFTFKQRRFETMHAPALRWPPHKFEYIGVDPPASTGFNLAEASNGEMENAAKPFEQDPYGCHSQVLQEKRRQRNPFSRTPPYQLSCPDMKELLIHCGPELISTSLVPWPRD